jgi:hypothetical protein
MDWLVQRAFFEAVKAGRQTPIDVYNLVAWIAITALSEDSIACGSQAVPFSDFTNGKWIRQQPQPDCYWTLEGIYEGER